MAYMIGVDVGGTFTDFSVFDQESGELFHHKDSSVRSIDCEISVFVRNGTGKGAFYDHACADDGNTLIVANLSGDMSRLAGCSLHAQEHQHRYDPS